jgi:eukaryotic-like serine/threonine-protein kinase
MIRQSQAGDPESAGPYRILGRLGAGGMGQVYLGRSAGGRLVAVKVIRPELAGEPGFRARFAHEVAAARNVSGLFTALVVDADADGPVPWLATAYVPGPSLAEAVEAYGPLPAGSVLTLAAGLAEGLAAIHAAGVVHRDLKPSNVLLADDGPRVIDFGISRAMEASALTQSGTVMGSPGFMSPEQSEGGVVGPPSDVFSLGAVLTFAATGEGPFGEGSGPALVYRVVHQLPDLTQLPGQIRPLVERCLAKEPSRRPTTTDVLAQVGSDEPAAGWLPDPVAEIVGRYVPAPAGVPWAPTVTSVTAPGVQAAHVRDSQPDRRRPRLARRRLTWLAAAAGLVATAASLVIVVPRADGAAGVGRPRVSVSQQAPSARDHSFPVAAGPNAPVAASVAPAKTAKKVTRTSPRAGREPVAAAPANPAFPGASPGGPVAASSAPPSPAPARTPAPTTAAVPDVLYTTLSGAAATLKGRGFDNIPYVYGCYGSSYIDDVIRQDPAADARIALTAPVQLYLQANNCDTVPNVIGMNLSNAAYTLKQAGFDNIPYVYGCYGSSEIGDVVRQSPGAGVRYGSTQPVSLKLQANNC